MRFHHWSLVGASCVLLACSSSKPVDPADVVKLNPLVLTAERSGRQGHVALSELATLQDRNLSTHMPLVTPLRVTARFSAPVTLSAVKLFGAQDVRLVLHGEGLKVQGSATGWTRVEVAGQERKDELDFELVPTSANARLGELELWGVGRKSAPRDPGVMVRVPDPRVFENLWRVDGVPREAELVAGGPEACVAAQFDLPVSPRGVRRAFISYSGTGLKRPVVLRRSINGHGRTGGFWMGPTTDARSVIDELDPAELGATTHVSLCLPDEATLPVRLEGLALVVELDDGTNLLDRATQVDAAEAWDSDPSTARGVRELTMGFARATELDRSWLVTDGPESVLDVVEMNGSTGWETLAQSVALEQGSAQLEWPPGRAHATGLRLRFAGAARADVPSAHVTEVGVAGSPVGPIRPQLVVTYPTTPEHFGRTAYVAGFITQDPNGPRVVELAIDGEVQPPGNSFGKRLERDADESGTWRVELRARLSDGTTLSRSLVLSEDRSRDLLDDGGLEGDAASSADELFGAVDQIAAASLAEEGGEVRLGKRAKLSVPPGALKNRTNLTVQRKAATAVPPLDPGLLNVTAPGGSGYRFRPRGQKFAKAVRVELPYDVGLLPSTMSPEEVRTYYYDEALTRWVPLPKVATHRTSKTVESETDHFTFMINAVLVVPDHPGTTTFNPNSLKGLKTADPSAAIDFIAPPVGNNRGSANVTFPIRLPPGRGNFQPQVALSYDSQGGNGWVGEGWSVPVSSVDVHTGFGVPAYDGSERYTLDGEMLVESSEETCIDGGSGKRFVPRTERKFQRIRRCGRSALVTASEADRSYYWEVTDTAGTVFVYGRSEQARLADYRIGAEYIARWMLERVVDVNGNLTQYTYRPDDEREQNGCPNGAAVCEPFRQLYLASITYSGMNAGPLAGGTPGRFHVDFTPEYKDERPVERSDVLVSARTGFKVLTRYRLDRIAVRLDDELIREYQLKYEAGDFGKSILTSVGLFDAAGVRFYEHGFDYHRRAQQLATRAFSAPVEFLSEANDPSPINETTETSSNLHLFVGLSPTPIKIPAVGLKGAYDSTDRTTRSVLMDLNGDRLPDRLLAAAGDRLQVQFNHGAPQLLDFAPQAPVTRFSPATPWSDPYRGAAEDLALGALPDLGTEHSNAFSVGLEVHAKVAGFSLGTTFSSAYGRSTLLDADGDGLLDHASTSGVRFQRERRADCRAGDLTCRTPDRIDFVAGQTIAADAAKALLDDAALKEAEAELKEEFYPEDAILQWVAPFGGKVSVSARVKRRMAGGQDGVQLNLFKNNEALAFSIDGKPAQRGWTFGKDDVAEHELTLPVLELNSRDRLYFKLGTGDDFPVRIDSPPPAPIDELAFAPVIRYLERDRALREPSGGRVFEYALEEDFRVAGDPIAASVVGRKGALRVHTTLRKTPSTDGVRVCLQRYKEGEKLRPRACSAGDIQLLSQPAAAAGDSSDVRSVRVEEGEQLVFREETDTPADPAKAVVNVTVQVEEICIKGACKAVPLSGPQSISFTPPVFVAAHIPARTPVTPFIVAEDGDYELEGTLRGMALRTPTFVAVTRNGVEQLFKREIKDCWVDFPDGRRCVPEVLETVHLRLSQGDQVTFEMHGEVESEAGWSPTLFKRVRTDGGDVRVEVEGVPVHQTFDVYLPEPMLFDDPRLVALRERVFREAIPLAGGFRGWRFGQWNGNKPFDETRLGKLEENKYEDKDEDEIVDEATESALDESSDEAAILRLFVPMAPAANGVELRRVEPLWMGPDGFSYIGKGVMHAGRKGGYAVGEPEGGVQGGVLAAFRLGTRLSLATNRSLNVGASLAFLSGSAGYGWSDSKLALMDMNGDGIVDIVKPGASSLTTRVFTRGKSDVPFPGESVSIDPKNPASATQPRGIRHSQDLTLSAGMGIGSVVAQLRPDGEHTQANSRSPGLLLMGGLGFGISRQAVTQDLIDVNGDGLPDRVRRDGGDFHVHLNLGNRFADSADVYPVAAWGSTLDGFSQFVSDKAPELSTERSGEKKSEKAREERRKALSGTMALVNNANVLQHSSTMSLTENLGVGIDADVGFGVSRNLETSLTKVPVELVDVTGDGLPDYVKKGTSDGSFRVQVNLGHGFSEEVPMAAPAWRVDGRALALPCFRTQSTVPGLDLSLSDFMGAVLGQDKALCSSPLPRGVDTLAARGVHSLKDRPSAGAYFTVTIPFVFINLIINPGADVASRASGFELGMTDINGDGFADHVLKTRDEGSVYARVNQMAGGNLLRQVRSPLGGSFRLAYTRLGNTVAMPESRFVLHQVEVDDGRGSAAGAEGHVFTTTYQYEDGRYDRRNREFYGFGRVLRKNSDESTLEQLFHVDAFATRGLLASEMLRDRAGRPLMLRSNEYAALRVGDALAECVQRQPYPLNQDVATCDSVFPALKAERQEFFEGESAAGVTKRTVYTYDCESTRLACFGNVKSFSDQGGTGPDDDVTAVIEYSDDLPGLLSKHVVGAARTITVTDAGGKVLRKRSAKLDDRGRVMEHEAANEGFEGGPAVTNLTWTTHGNLESVTGPENHKRARHSVTYTYDELVRTYVDSARDIHGLTSAWRYDAKFGEPVATVDAAGNCTARKLDSFGRVSAVFGPDDAEYDAEHGCLPRSGAQPSWHVDYFHAASPAYATTRHSLPPSGGGLSNGGRSLDTVVFMDGMRRTIQTKKRTEMAQGDGTSIGYAVSGAVLFDARGAIAAQGQPSFSQAAEGVFVTGTGLLRPTYYTDDVLGRRIATEYADGTSDSVTYGFGSPAGDSTPGFREEWKDGNGKVRVIFRDARSRIVAVEERLAGDSRLTRYRYNPLGEMTTVVDALGNVTSITYDALGRRRSVLSPDSGLTEFKFDPAGNLVGKIDENLRLNGGAIEYDYEYNRLMGISSPSSPSVSFSYGKSGAAENAAGRIVQVKDGAGEESRGYDRLGNVVHVSRTVESFRPGAPRRAFTQRFDFDQFGRMLSLEYPDGEVVTYDYDAGGLLRSATGTHGGARQAYLSRLRYDEFGQRVSLELGNGTSTRFDYYPDSRRLWKLTTTARTRSGPRDVQRYVYVYDAVGNVKSITNEQEDAARRSPGYVHQSFDYDDLNRLVTATGSAELLPNTVDRYEASFGYDEIHNMTSKTQAHVITEPSGQQVAHKKTNHVLDYRYDGPRPHAATSIGDTQMEYDPNGNVLVETTPTGVGPRHRRFVWGDGGQLRAVLDNGNATSFLYDASGQRVVKRGKFGETVYLGQFYTVQNAGRATKHVFAGPDRVASKLAQPPRHNSTSQIEGEVTPVRLTGIARACEVGDGQQTGLDGRCPSESPGAGGEVGGALEARPETFWHHPDHVGSASVLTDERGEVFEHVAYFPYGEVWIDEGPKRPLSQFGFTGKPTDPETDLIYFGKRYYDPRRAHWVSTDPDFVDYLPDLVPDAEAGVLGFKLEEPSSLPGMGGIFAPVNLALYHYAALSPRTYVDPTGGSDNLPVPGHEGWLYRRDDTLLPGGRIASEIELIDPSGATVGRFDPETFAGLNSHGVQTDAANLTKTGKSALAEVIAKKKPRNLDKATAAAIGSTRVGKAVLKKLLKLAPVIAWASIAYTAHTQGPEAAIKEATNLDLVETGLIEMSDAAYEHMEQSQVARDITSNARKADEIKED